MYFILYPEAKHSQKMQIIEYKVSTTAPFNTMSKSILFSQENLHFSSLLKAITTTKYLREFSPQTRVQIFKLQD